MTVTLITGDRVVAGRDGTVRRVIRAKGREKTAFSLQREAGHSYAIPLDALALIGRGVLDRRLFDITRLVADRYDDAHRPSLPLIVEYQRPGGPSTTTPSASAAPSARAVGDPFAAVAGHRTPLPAVGGEAFHARKSDTPALWAAVARGTGTPAAGGYAAGAGTVARVWLDALVRPSLDRSVAQIGAPTMWQNGFTGKGVKVAVLDTGVDEKHPDLKGVEVAHKNFVTPGDDRDTYGHGTHVASTIAGSGARSGGRYKGVAPGARILDAKVLAGAEGGPDSGIIAGMQWAVDQGAKVVNMSLGSQDEQGTDLMEEAVARLSGRALFVASAGNLNSTGRPGTITSPGSAPAALTVGAVDKSGVIADFSSYGPNADGVAKPDLTAPGVEITAAESTDVPTPGGTGYVANSGTSMAAPHAAGAAALLLQQHPDWTGARLKSVLTGSAKPSTLLDAYRQGAGLVDLKRASTASAVSEPGSLAFGTQQWPHGDDKTVTRTLTYRNFAAKAVTLKLTPQGTDPEGRPAPAGMFTIKDAQLTVPAGGTARTTVTVDLRKGSVDGAFGGSVLASGGGQSVRTGLVAVRETEAYDLTLAHTRLDGKGARDYSTKFTRHGTGEIFRAAVDGSGGGRTTVRLPKGRYSLESTVFDGANRFAVFVQPVLDVKGKATIALDARKAKPLAVTTPDPAAKAVGAMIGYGYTPTDLSGAWSVTDQSTFRSAALGPAAPELGAQFSGVWKAPAGAGQGQGAVYRLAFNRTGSWFTGLAHATTKAELAEVKLGVGASVPGAKGDLTATPRGADGFAVEPGEERVTLPHTARTFVTAGGLHWDWRVRQLDAAGNPRLAYYANDLVPTAGKSRTLTLAAGVFGPDLAADSSQYASRNGDSINAIVGLFADGAGHPGESETTQGFSRLESGGRILARSDAGALYADVPAGSAAYKLTMEASRSPKDTAIGTKVTAVWGFTSAHVPEDRNEVLPLSTVRISPALSLSGTAKAGSSLTVPLNLAGAAARPGALASLKVAVSYDGGAWTEVPVTAGTGGRYTATVAHPAGAKAVSYRVDVRDKAGNTLRETLVNAYRLTP
ncbi:S8 family serine peptidase [Streptomyces sp. NPDC002073]